MFRRRPVRLLNVLVRLIYVLCTGERIIRGRIINTFSTEKHQCCFETGGTGGEWRVRE